MNRKGVFLSRDYIELLRGDISAALMLSQIVYWYLPSKKTGKSKLRVFRGGRWWLAKSHQDWSDECGFSRMQARRCIKVLKEAHLIECHIFRFAGSPTMHLRLVREERPIHLSPLGPSTRALKAHPYTESTYREYDRGSSAEDRTRAGEIQTTTAREQEERGYEELVDSPCRSTVVGRLLSAYGHHATEEGQVRK